MAREFDTIDDHLAGPIARQTLFFVGSGVETIAHLRENGRIVVKLCAFCGPPRIVRLDGLATVDPPG